MVLVGYLAMLVAGVPRDGRVSTWQFWPSKRLTAWAEQRRPSWLGPFIGVHDEFLEIDCGRGVVTRTAAMRPGRSRHRMVLAPDGRHAYRRVRDGVEGFSLVTGRRTSHVRLGFTRSPGPPRPTSSVVAFRDGGRDVIVSGWREEDHQTVVVAWNQRTGSVRELITVPSISNPTMRPELIVTADRRSDPRRLVLSSGLLEATEWSEVRMIVCDLDEALTVRAEHTFVDEPASRAAPRIMPGAMPVVSADGLLAFVTGSSGFADVLGIDLETGQPFDLVRSGLGEGPSWDGLALSENGSRLATWSGIGKRLLVRDVAQPTWIAQCPYPSDIDYPWPTLSHDGSRLAAIGYRGPLNAVLLLYDLKSLASAAEPSE